VPGAFSLLGPALQATQVGGSRLSRAEVSSGQPYPDAIPARYGAVVLAFVLGFVAAVVLFVTVCPASVHSMDSPVITPGGASVVTPFTATP